MRISDWNSDVCSSDLPAPCLVEFRLVVARTDQRGQARLEGGGIRESPRRRQGMDSHPRSNDDGELSVTEIWMICDQHSIALSTGVELGRAACRARVCPSVEISLVAGSFKKKKKY